MGGNAGAKLGVKWSKTEVQNITGGNSDMKK